MTVKTGENNADPRRLMQRYFEPCVQSEDYDELSGCTRVPAGRKCRASLNLVWHLEERGCHRSLARPAEEGAALFQKRKFGLILGMNSITQTTQLISPLGVPNCSAFSHKSTNSRDNPLRATFTAVPPMTTSRSSG